MLLLSMQAGGVGLNLVAANHCVVVDLPFNPATLDQVRWVYPRPSHNIARTRKSAICVLVTSTFVLVGVYSFKHSFLTYPHISNEIATARLRTVFTASDSSALSQCTHLCVQELLRSGR